MALRKKLKIKRVSIEERREDWKRMHVSTKVDSCDYQHQQQKLY